MMRHLSLLHAEDVLGPVDLVSLGFVFVEGLHDILDPPQLFLDADVLLAGGLRLRKHKCVLSFCDERPACCGKTLRDMRK